YRVREPLPRLSSLRTLRPPSRASSVRERAPAARRTAQFTLVLHAFAGTLLGCVHAAVRGRGVREARVVLHVVGEVKHGGRGSKGGGGARARWRKGYEHCARNVALHTKTMPVQVAGASACPSLPFPYPLPPPPRALNQGPRARPRTKDTTRAFFHEGEALVPDTDAACVLGEERS
ncbi:hypothetical protein DFH06DRAFT_1203025, partial [Mycena polygramma]